MAVRLATYDDTREDGGNDATLLRARILEAAPHAQPTLAKLRSWLVDGVAVTDGTILVVIVREPQYGILNCPLMGPESAAISAIVPVLRDTLERALARWPDALGWNIIGEWYGDLTTSRAEAQRQSLAKARAWQRALRRSDILIYDSPDSMWTRFEIPVASLREALSGAQTAA